MIVVGCQVAAQFLVEVEVLLHADEVEVVVGQIAADDGGVLCVGTVVIDEIVCGQTIDIEGTYGEERSIDGAWGAEVLADEGLNEFQTAGLVDVTTARGRRLLHAGKVHKDNTCRGIMERILQIVDYEAVGACGILAVVVRAYHALIAC